MGGDFDDSEVLVVLDEADFEDLVTTYNFNLVDEISMIFSVT